MIRLQKGVSYKGEFLDKPGPRLLGLGTIALGGGLMLDKARTYSGPIRNGQRARPGDLLIAVVGITPEGSVIGSPALIPTDAEGEFAITHHVVRVDVIDKEYVDVRFLYYRLRDQDFSEYVRGVQYGSTVPAVSTRDLLSYEVPLPPIKEQQVIASILGSLDDKIELNRRMNQTLEEIARALFKFWFVDFGPVRAKGEGRWKKGESLPGMPADMWDLWPSEFEESEIGEIPKGWGVMTLESLCSSITNGGTPRRAESKYWESGHIPWFKTGELRDGPLIDSEEHISEDGLRDSACRLWKRDTVLIALYASPTVGRLGLLKTEATANQACSALSARPEVGYAFLFQTLLCARDGLIQVAVGSAQQNISQEVIRNYPVLAPPPEFTSEFQARTAPLYDAMTMGLRQSAVLSLLRDALLPKLLSGEIRVPVNGGR